MTRFSNEHTLLWKEEPDCLASWADAVPDGGRILEIGTAEGGSARIMDKVVAGRGVSICTVDLAPSEKAAELLSSTSVKMVKAPSASFAKSWSEADRIDLLFIDGDHSFKGIYEDFVSWAPFLSSGGRVLFHDVDPVERGGIAHLGVRIFVDALIGNGVLRDAERRYRFVHAAVSRPEAAGDVAIFAKELKRVVDEAKTLVSKVFADGPERGMERLKERAFAMSSFDACCCVGHLLDKHYHALLNAGDKSEIMRWAESVWMLEHGFADAVRPESMDGRVFEGLTDYLSVSRLVSRIQTALFLYRGIARCIIPWNL